MLAVAFMSAAGAEPVQPPPPAASLRFSLQVGAAEGARSVTLGVARDWDRRWQTRWGTLGGYWELSLGRWFNRSHSEGARDVTQLGLTPVLRLYPQRSENWYVEVGIGLNLITPHYSSAGRRFSSKFNFGDHIAIGRRFGAGSAHEIALRLQHFSNAGIDHPNPGENFVQLRYAQRW